MNEDDHIKEFLRFTSEDELIRLAEIGLAVEMHQAAQRFFPRQDGRSLYGGNCGKTQSLPRTQSRRLLLAQGHCYPGVRIMNSFTMLGAGCKKLNPLHNN